MNYAKGCLLLIGLIGLLIVATLVFGGVWFSKNMDKVADAAVEASGIKEKIAKEDQARCESAKRRAQAEWERAVASGRVNDYTAEIDELDAQAKRLCAKN